jgi:alanyl-tRNA synthetase
MNTHNNGSIPVIVNANNKTNNTINQIGGNNSQHVENKINEAIDRVKQMNQTAIKLQEMKKKMKPKKMKQKKTKRRTYKIGKSKVLPKVSVLVSNKTIRNNISTKKQLLKQVPIQEVKSYLMKRGFIKVGSTAPSDVLRKMYESAVMICGEVQNHNPDNLLYNYFNGGDT